MSGHESLQSHRTIAAASDRTFGLVVGSAFSLVGLWPLLVHGASPRWWAVALGAALIVLALVAKERLAPLNRLWMRLGASMQSIVSPVVMSALFFAAVTPMAFVVRALGKDLLRLQRDDAAASYWMARDPPGPSEGSMKNQF
jgi:hypothetical protein